MTEEAKAILSKRACASCRKWGLSQPPPGNAFSADSRWQWCETTPASWASADYVCGEYGRIGPDEIEARLAIVGAAEVVA